MTNAESVNHWKIDKGIRPLVESVKQDYENLHKNILEPINKARLPGSKVIYHTGNHEDWFYQAMDRDARLTGLLGLEDNIDTKKYNMTIIPMNSVINFGFLHFTHGIYTNQYHSAKMAANYRRCIVYGHTHDMQEHTIVSPIDVEEKILARSIGCLCNMNPYYQKGKPHKWVHAFHIAYVRSDGTFNDYPIVITRGRFTSPEGREYGKEY